MKLTKISNILIFIFSILYALIAYPILMCLYLLIRIFVVKEFKCFIGKFFYREETKIIKHNSIPSRCDGVFEIRYEYSNPIYWLIDNETPFVLATQENIIAEYNLLDSGF